MIFFCWGIVLSSRVIFFRDFLGKVLARLSDIHAESLAESNKQTTLCEAPDWSRIVFSSARFTMMVSCPLNASIVLFVLSGNFLFEQTRGWWLPVVSWQSPWRSQSVSLGSLHWATSLWWVAKQRGQAFASFTACNFSSCFIFARTGQRATDLALAPIMGGFILGWPPPAPQPLMGQITSPLRPPPPLDAPDASSPLKLEVSFALLLSYFVSLFVSLVVKVLSFGFLSSFAICSWSTLLCSNFSWSSTKSLNISCFRSSNSCADKLVSASDAFNQSFSKLSALGLLILVRQMFINVKSSLEMSETRFSFEMSEWIEE